VPATRHGPVLLREPLHQARDASRLLNDTRLLADHSRLANAFALAVLAVEEIGRALRDRQARIRARTITARLALVGTILAIGAPPRIKMRTHIIEIARDFSRWPKVGQ
jgi:hypothetical protein